MDRLDKLRAFVDAVISGETDSQDVIMAEYLTTKTKELVEFVGKNSPIKLKGDDVFVMGKKVGVVHTDLDDFDSGINFKSSDGKFSKEFQDVDELYAFIAQQYNIKEDVEDAEDAIKQRDDKRSERIQRWVDVRKNATDGSTGEHDSKELKHDDSVKEKEAEGVDGDQVAKCDDGYDKNDLSGHDKD